MRKEFNFVEAGREVVVSWPWPLLLLRLRAVFRACPFCLMARCSASFNHLCVLGTPCAACMNVLGAAVQVGGCRDGGRVCAYNTSSLPNTQHLPAHCMKQRARRVEA